MTTASITSNLAPTSAVRHAELQRNAYNAAFYELGLRWHWDDRTWQALLPIEREEQRIRHYVETEHKHLLSVYEPAFLVDAIQESKARCYENMLRAAVRDPHAAQLDWADFHCSQVGH